MRRGRRRSGGKDVSSHLLYDQQVPPGIRAYREFWCSGLVITVPWTLGTCGRGGVCARAMERNGQGQLCIFLGPSAVICVYNVCECVFTSCLILSYFY